MNAPKVTDLDYINFLIAAPKVVSCSEAARVQPEAGEVHLARAIRFYWGSRDYVSALAELKTELEDTA